LDTAQVDLRRRLEEQWSADRKRDGQAVYDDTAPYQVRSRWDEAEGNDANALSSVRTLQFESRFESGNLQRAVKVGSTEYDLYLRPDKGCGHVQWYYFMVRNMKPGVPYIFNIVNFVKNKSLYNAGLRPLIYSEKEARGRRGCTGWHRTGSKCVYYQRGARYALTFETTFKHEGDTCFFAHCYPYTYSDSQLFLAGLLQDPDRSKWYEVIRVPLAVCLPLCACAIAQSRASFLRLYTQSIKEWTMRKPWKICFLTLGFSGANEENSVGPWQVMPRWLVLLLDHWLCGLCCWDADDELQIMWTLTNWMCKMVGNAVDLLEIGEDVHPETSATVRSKLLE
jgi:hypothetical protein